MKNDMLEYALELELVEPSYHYKQQYMDMIREWESTGEKLEPFVLRMDCSDFAAYLQVLANMENESTAGKKTVNSSTYWLVNNKRKVIGAVNIRHALNEHFVRLGGHISYGIRPSERSQGFGTRLLAMALQRAYEFGIERVLLTCDRTHAAALQTIERNGGVLENETFFAGKMVRRYWIDLAKD